MFNTQPLQLSSRTRLSARTRRGQSIVVALLVLLLLGLVGSLFVTVVARNIQNAGHSVRVQTAGSYARAGITYADTQLSSSADGADWRPTLQFQLAVPPTEARELARYNAAVTANALPTVSVNDPDHAYLEAGFARYNTGAGRYLIRVTYDPVNLGPGGVPLTVPAGKYLKIESVGREGTIDPTDPTTYTNNRTSDRTVATLVALKPIGITDYARFETNPDRRSDIANLGVVSQLYSNSDGSIATPGVFDFITSSGGVANPPTIQEYPVLTTYGADNAYVYKTGTAGPLQANPTAGSSVPTNYSPLPGGGSIHSNMPVRFFGANLIYLHSGGDSPLYQDTAEIGGDLLLDNYNQNATLNNSTLDANGNGQQASLILNPKDSTKLIASPISDMLATSTAPAMPPYNTYIAPSNSKAGSLNGDFSTYKGLVRDGSMQNDPAGLPRSITRLEPPVLDAQDPASQMPRYRAIAMNSAPRSNLTLNGSAYTPPAGTNPSLYGYGKAIYVNNPNDVQTDSAAIGGGSTLTDEWLHRTPGNTGEDGKGGWNGLFYNPPGVTIVLGQRITTTVGAATTTAYGIRLTRSNSDSFASPDGVAGASTVMDVPYSTLDTDRTGATSDNDITIYAEGNVRVRGILSPNEGTSFTPPVASRHITIVTNGTAYIEGNLLKGTPDSSISVLAHDYVCVNTTQFLAGPIIEEHNDGRQSPTLPKPGEPTNKPLSLDDTNSLVQEFNFGLTGAATPASYPSKLALYIAAGPESPGNAKADFDILNLTTGTGLSPTPPVLSLDTFMRTTVDLSTSTSLSGALTTDLFQLSVRKDDGKEDVNTNISSTPGQNVSLERIAVLPMDIRIEAVLYAQTRSFFVIPGEWFNSNSADTLDTFRNGANSAAGASRAFTDSRFPLYGQPIDLKITVSGSVSEAHPADIAAQTTWMSKWGWIPQYHGSLIGNTPPAETAGHTVSGQPAIGLQIIYDPLAGYPYNPVPAAPATVPYYLRSDQFGRPLPFTPKLPVSPGLLYAGQSGDAPLLQ